MARRAIDADKFSNYYFVLKLSLHLFSFCVTLLLVNPKMEGSEYESTQTETYNIGERSKTT
jgi:hypothetical protein